MNDAQCSAAQARFQCALAVRVPLLDAWRPVVKPCFRFAAAVESDPKGHQWHLVLRGTTVLPPEPPLRIAIERTWTNFERQPQGVLVVRGGAMDVALSFRTPDEASMFCAMAAGTLKEHPLVEQPEAAMPRVHVAIDDCEMETHHGMVQYSAANGISEKYLALLTAELLRYSPRVLRDDFGLDLIVLCCNLFFDGARTRGLPLFGSRCLMLDVGALETDTMYARRVLHHELLHCLFYEQARGGRRDPMGELAHAFAPRTGGYITEYAATDPEEDAAEVFGLAAALGESGLLQLVALAESHGLFSLSDAEQIRKKMSALCAFLREHAPEVHVVVLDGVGSVAGLLNSVSLAG